MSVKSSRFSRRDVGGVHTNQHANIMTTDTSDISPGKLKHQQLEASQLNTEMYPSQVANFKVPRFFQHLVYRNT